MIRDLGAALRGRKVSCVELTRAALDAAERLNPRINAFITITAEAALARAAQLDAELARGYDRGPLHGIPIAVKDIIYTKGVRTTSGSRIYSDFVPKFDATVVRRLDEAGAVSIGKTGLHEIAYGITSNNPHFGAVRNPWDPERIPGGSSGGSGAAVAAGICAMALGTDTGGSIRIPASFCGVVGFKPTYGRVSRYGVFPLGFTLDHIGPIAASVEDAALTMSAIAGRDGGDPTTSHRTAPDYAHDLEADVAGLRIGRPNQFYFDRLEPGVAAALDRALKAAEAAGMRVVPVNVPDVEALNAVALTILLAEAAAAHEPHLDRWNELGADTRLLLSQGRMISGSAYVNATRLRARLVREFAEIWRKCHCLFLPATPTVAPRIGQTTVEIEGRTEDVRLLTTRCVRGINALGWPALSIPCGISDAMPVGLQIAGAPHTGGRVLAVGRAMEHAVGFSLRPEIR